MIDPTSFNGKVEYLHGKSLGRQCMDTPEKYPKLDLRFASYLFASCTICGVGVVRLKARSDTFHVADRLERIRGIYWLCCGDLEWEDSILFSLYM